MIRLGFDDLGVVLPGSNITSLPGIQTGIDPQMIQAALSASSTTYYTAPDSGGCPSGWTLAQTGVCTYKTAVGAAPPPYLSNHEVLVAVPSWPRSWPAGNVDLYPLTFIIGPTQIKGAVRNQAGNKGCIWWGYNHSSYLGSGYGLPGLVASVNSWLDSKFPSKVDGSCSVAQFDIPTPIGVPADSLWCWQAGVPNIPCLNLNENAKPPTASRLAHWKLAIQAQQNSIAWAQAHGTPQQVKDRQVILAGMQDGTFPFATFYVDGLSSQNQRSSTAAGPGTVHYDQVGLFYGDQTYGMLVFHRMPPFFVPDTGTTSSFLDAINPVNYITLAVSSLADLLLEIAKDILQAIEDIVSQILAMACDLTKGSTVGMAAAAAAGPQVLVAYKGAQALCAAGQQPAIPPSQPVSSFSALPWFIGALAAGGVAYLALKKPKNPHRSSP